MNGILNTYLVYSTRKKGFQTKVIAKKVRTQEDKQLPPDAMYPLMVECRTQAIAFKTYKYGR